MVSLPSGSHSLVLQFDSCSDLAALSDRRAKRLVPTSGAALIEQSGLCRTQSWVDPGLDRRDVLAAGWGLVLVTGAAGRARAV